eukprot:2877118-Prymnesium_polylepis.1
MPRSPPPMCPMVGCRAPAWWPAAASSSLTDTSRGAMDPPSRERPEPTPGIDYVKGKEREENS